MPNHTDYERIMAELTDLDLLKYAAELDMQGYTVVPPERMMTSVQRAELIEAILDWAEQCHGVRPDLNSSDVSAEQSSGFGDTMPTVLGAGPIFEKMLLHPVVMALATWQVGYRCILNHYGPSIKGSGGDPLPIHTDTQLIIQTPGPMPPYPVSVNCTLALTDFTRENGCTVIIPGSHKTCQWWEGSPLDEPRAVPIECSAGSLVVWEGRTAHGALPRTAPGKRVTLLLYFTRHWLQPRENWLDRLPQEVLDRNSPRLATLTGQHNAFNYATYEEFKTRAMRDSQHYTTMGQKPDQWT